MEQQKFNLQINAINNNGYSNDYDTTYDMNFSGDAPYNNQVYCDPIERQNNIKLCCGTILAIGNIIFGLWGFSLDFWGVLFTALLCGVSIFVSMKVLEQFFSLGINEWWTAIVGIVAGVAASAIGIMCAFVLVCFALLAFLGFIIYVLVSGA